MTENNKHNVLTRNSNKLENDEFNARNVECIKLEPQNDLQEQTKITAPEFVACASNIKMEFPDRPGDPEQDRTPSDFEESPLRKVVSEEVKEEPTVENRTVLDPLGVKDDPATAQRLHCKVKVEKVEYLNHHANPCHEKNLRSPEKGELQCPKCPYEAKRKQTFRQHLLIHDKVKNFRCDVCMKRFSNKGNLKVHRYTHDDKRPFICEICGNGYVQTTTLKVHIKRNHSIRCPHCRHEEIQDNSTGKEAFRCSECKQEFTYVGRCNKLIYRCTECSYVTNKKATFTKHQYTHGNNKPYKCLRCDKQFVVRSRLIHHMKTRHATSEDQIEMTLIKRFRCSICTFQTDYRWILQRHSAEHNDVEDEPMKYACVTCPYRTNDKRNFEQHKNIHEGIKPYNCERCDKRFRSKNNLNAHIKVKHS